MEPTPLALPQSLGSARQLAAAPDAPVVVVIATEPGHPPAAEQRALAVLRHLLAEGQGPAWLFVSIDASLRHGDVQPGRPESDLAPYRAFDTDHNRAITESLLDQGKAMAAWVYAVADDVASHVQTCDHWLAWALQRDALRQLTARSGEVELILNLAELVVAIGAADQQQVADLSRLLRLELDAEEWLRRRDPLLALDLGALFAQLGPLDPGQQEAITNLSRLQTLASTYYDAGIARCDSLIAQARERIRALAGARSAVIVAGPWLDYVCDQLQRAGLSVVRIVSRGISRRSGLDGAFDLIDSLDYRNRSNLDRLMLGEPQASAVEPALRSERGLREDWSGDWAAAGQALYLLAPTYGAEKQKAQASACLERALWLNPASASAWAFTGMALASQEPRRAMVALELAEQLSGLQAMDRHKVALGWFELMDFTRSARIFSTLLLHDPKDGLSWHNLGASLQNLGRLAEARYCYNRGAALGMPESPQMAREVASHPLAWLPICPPKLLPPIRLVTSRFLADLSGVLRAV